MDRIAGREREPQSQFVLSLFGSDRRSMDQLKTCVLKWDLRSCLGIVVEVQFLVVTIASILTYIQQS